MSDLYHAILTSVFNGDTLTFNYESQDRFEKAACLLSDVELYDLVDWVKSDLVIDLFNAHGLIINGLTVSIEPNPDTFNDGLEWSLSDNDNELNNGIEFTYNDCIQSATKGL